MAEHTYLRTHDLAAEHLVLDLGQVARDLHGDAPAEHSRGGITLVKQQGMSLVVTHLPAGSSFKEHSAPGPTTVQVLDGNVRIRVGDESIEASSGRLIAFQGGVRHSVDAIEDSTLLLTINAV
jgi:quercetin dioxygenase-like cupin family protein